jgi:predicted polyphosphate/ATP-dependent NAD kinase
VRLRPLAGYLYIIKSSMTDGLLLKPLRADSAQRCPLSVPRLNPAATLLFVINTSSGALDIDAKRAVIESALAMRGRKGELMVCGPADLPRVAADAAAAAVAHGKAVIAVGGDGSLNTVAQAANAAGCPMGVIPYGTFNYFARLVPRYCAYCDGCACISRQVPRFATCRP